jgi:hypothetical protein
MKQIVIMPGGFHPFHAGHYALYKSALEAFPQADVYVAATNDQSERPFPFSIKEKLAKLAGVQQGRFVQVKSPFQAKEITQNYDPNSDVLIFVRSEKDKNESPKPGGTKKDGSPAYFQPYTGKDLQPFSKHAYFAYLPTVTFGPGIQSATEIRNAWPNLDDRRKTAMVMSLYPATQKNPKLAQNVVQLLDVGMGGSENVTESYSNTTFQTERRRLNVPALIKAGALFVTYPHGEQGWETDNQEDWAYSLISLYNVMQGGWPSESKKYLKPASYKKAEQQINSSAPNLGSDKLVYDGKYNQILWSIKKLGIPDNIAFLDDGQQGIAKDDSPRIKLGGDSSAAKAWIERVHAKYPYTMQNNHVMVWGKGDDQQFAMFELTPSFSKRGAVEVKWIQAYPLRQGVGSRAMQELQAMAREDGISLTLFPWDKGQVSQSKLTKFYRGQGFTPTVKGSKSMQWEPK